MKGELEQDRQTDGRTTKDHRGGLWAFCLLVSIADGLHHSLRQKTNCKKNDEQPIPSCMAVFQSSPCHEKPRLFHHLRPVGVLELNCQRSRRGRTLHGQ